MDYVKEALHGTAFNCCTVNCSVLYHRSHTEIFNKCSDRGEYTPLLFSTKHNELLRLMEMLLVLQVCCYINISSGQLQKLDLMVVKDKKSENHQVISAHPKGDTCASKVS